MRGVAVGWRSVFGVALRRLRRWSVLFLGALTGSGSRSVQIGGMFPARRWRFCAVSISEFAQNEGEKEPFEVST